MNLSPEDEAMLDSLNAEVTSALSRRKEWLDSAMARLSPLKAGDELWDVNAMRLLGIVTGLYRFHAEHSPLYDTSLSISYEYRTVDGHIDNTSRQVGLRYGTREEAMAEQKARIARVEAMPKFDPGISYEERLARIVFA